MKIIYISHWRFPSEKTMSPLIMKTCEGFASSRIDTDTGRIFTDTSQRIPEDIERISTDNPRESAVYPQKSTGLLYEDLTYKIRGAVFSVYNSLGFGHKESVYQKALEHELKKIGVRFESQKSIDLTYDGQRVGAYKPDVIIESKIILELKSSACLTKEDKQQVIYYLKGTGYPLALLINFGPPKLQIERLINTTSGMQKSERNICENQSVNPRKSEKIEVELWVPWRQNRGFSDKDPFEYHGIERNFMIRPIPSFDFTAALPGNLFFYLMLATFQIFLFFSLLKSNFSRKFDFLYFHDVRDAVSPAILGKPMFLEIHDFYKSKIGWINRRMFRRMAGLVVTNRFKMEALKKDFGIPGNRMLHQPNAVDLKMFSIYTSQEDARKSLDLPLDKKIILYTGHLFYWKGVDVLLEAGKFLSQKEAVYFVGGTDDDIEKFKVKCRMSDVKCHVVGRRPHKEIPLWLRAADILVLPSPAKFLESKFETSPVKLFEYMASGTPIIASDLPSIRDIVDENMVWFFEPDSPSSLGEVVNTVFEHKEDAIQRSRRCREEVKKYTWELRNSAIVEFLRRKLKEAPLGLNLERR